MRRIICRGGKKGGRVKIVARKSYKLRLARQGHRRSGKWQKLLDRTRLQEGFHCVGYRDGWGSHDCLFGCLY